MFRVLFLVICTSLILTSCSTGVSPDSLLNPSFSWSAGNGLCGFVRTVDATGDLWDNKGCEDGSLKLHKLGRLSQEKLDDLTQYFESLSEPNSEALACEAGAANRFVWQESAAVVKVWQVGCSAGFYSTDGLPEPYLSIAKIFLL